MELNEYQAQAIKTAKRHPNREVAMLYFSGSLCGEAGEAFEVVKKHIRDGTHLNISELTSELGDVLWYLAVVAETHDLSLDLIARRNLAKLRLRYPSGEFREEDSHRNREE